MNYTIRHHTENGLKLVQLRDKKNDCLVSVLPEFGALLHTFQISWNGEALNVLDSYAGLEQLKTHLDTSYKGSKLSPFVCRIRDGKYDFEGRSYEFKRKFLDGSAIHGLLYNKAFQVVQEKQGPDSARVSLLYRYRKDDDQYPFNYDCQVNYTLFSDQVLELQTIVRNQSDTSLPIADGWHPYFCLKGNVDEWMLHFKAEAMVEFDKHLLPTGRLLPFDQFEIPAKIGDLELDNCFLVRTGGDLPACELFNPINKVKVAFYPDNAYPYLQIYTPPHRKSIAIENLSSAPDSFNNHMGLMILRPGQAQTFTVQYKLSLV